MTDYFTKWAEAVPIKNKRKETVAHAIFKEWYCRHGIPQQKKGWTCQTPVKIVKIISKYIFFKVGGNKYIFSFIFRMPGPPCLNQW